MLGKFGDQGRIDAAHARLSELGKEDGIDFNFDAIKVAPNTLDAHRVVRWAATTGSQGAVVADLFSRFFERGQNIGSPDVLRSAAATSGMDPAVVETLLATDADKAEVRTEIETAGRMGITGVPCFIIANKYAVMGAQPAEALADAISKAAAEPLAG
jgi:predicted DsbA family dithiol-disulfide isomerase